MVQSTDWSYNHSLPGILLFIIGTWTKCTVYSFPIVNVYAGKWVGGSNASQIQRNDLIHPNVLRLHSILKLGFFVLTPFIECCCVWVLEWVNVTQLGSGSKTKDDAEEGDERRTAVALSLWVWWNMILKKMRFPLTGLFGVFVASTVQSLCSSTGWSLVALDGQNCKIYVASFHHHVCHPQLCIQHYSTHGSGETYSNMSFFFHSFSVVAALPPLNILIRCYPIPVNPKSLLIKYSSQGFYLFYILLEVLH